MTDRIIAIAAIVSGLTATAVSGLCALGLNLILSKIEDINKRVGNIEHELINQALRGHRS